MLLAAATANAAQGWTLDQCIEYAIENNIQVRQSDLNAQNNDVELNKAVSNRLNINEVWQVFGELWNEKPETLRSYLNKALDQKKSLKFQDRLKNILG